MSDWIPGLVGRVARGSFYTVTGLLTVVGGGLYAFQNKLIYPSMVPQGARQFVDTPAKYGIDEFEDLTLMSDGVKIRAYLMLQPDAPQRPTLLFLHANAGNMGHRLPIARVFYRDMQLNVMMLSYRGYGLSEGAADEAGMRIDAQTALDHILEHTKLARTRIVLYGQSIGGAVAIDLAGRNQDRLAGLIIENTFLSLPKLVPSIFPFLQPFMFLLHQIWPSDSIVPNLKLPVLFLSGAQDEMIPPVHMRELYELCGSENKDMQKFAKGTHNDTCIQPGYFEAIMVFLRDRVLHRPQRSTTLDPDRVAGEGDSLRREGAGAGSRVPHL